MISLQREYLSESFIEEVTPLLHLHKDEVSVYDFFELSPRWDIYQQLEDMNLFYIFTARDSDGRLLGYSSYAVSPSLHYSKEMFADMDVIFVEESVRNSNIGTDLLTLAEEVLVTEHPVTVITIKMKVWAPFKGLATMAGYEEKEILFTKYLGD